ncbi:MAG: Gfo/Idh/MocA family oxidoreductase [Acidobacteriota bacterium]
MPKAIRIGIVGTGMIAGAIARAIAQSPNGVLVAASSRRAERAAEFLAEQGADPGARPFGSWEELLAWDGVDGVYIATPTHVREAIAVAAAAAGMHVLADKPFDGLASLRRITAACREHGVAFLDATHFSHHPRTRRLRDEIAGHLQGAHALRSAFFFPMDDRGNIRYDPTQEPTGAHGDMAWYSMRAAVEYLPGAMGAVRRVQAHVRRDSETGAVVRTAGFLAFEDGSSTTWDVGFDTGALIMDLDILGPGGLLSLDDFVLDWGHGFPFDDPEHDVGFTVRTGAAGPADFRFVTVPNDRPAQVRMIDAFAGLAEDPTSKDQADAIARSERTQELLDITWAAATEDA